jgi:energy-coupling factor transporter ATP-binding protein EcfA2
VPISLKKLKMNIMPIDVEILKEKMEAGKKCVEKVRNQDILLLIGGTGSGKSLTIQFLAGSKIEKRDKVNDKGGIL